MTRQQHQHPSQGTSSLSPPSGDRRDTPSQAAQQAPSASGDHAPSDHGMNTDHRASHVSSTDSDRFGSHASMGGIDERGSQGGAAQSMGHGGGPSGAPEDPQASPAQRQPTRGGAQTGLTGSISQREHGQSQVGGEHAGSDEPSRSKYSPTANEQDRLSQQQGGESLRTSQPAQGDHAQATGGARAESSQFAQPPGGSDSGDTNATDQSTRSSVSRVERPGAQGGQRSSPRQGPQSDNDSPVAAPAAPRGKQTATHDIDLAGPNSSGTNRDR